MSNSPAELTALRTLHEIVEQSALMRPDSIAVEHGDTRLTYRELNARANRLAAHLQSLGAARDEVVGLAMTRSAEMIVALLAILKSGAAYMPLDPEYPSERIDFMLSDSGAAIVVTDRALEERFSAGPARSIVVADGQEVLEGSDENPRPYDDGRLAYVIYTSGSTGKPKGVLIEHRSAVSYIAVARQTYGTRPSDRVLLFTSISFDPSVQDMFVTFASGATLVIRTPEMTSSFPFFIRELERLGVTVLSVPTAFWRELVTGTDRLPRSLRCAVIGGEQAYPQHVARWRALTDAPLWNAYGPTETTIAIAVCDVAHEETSHHVPVGRPLPGVEVHILDEQLQPVRPGEMGEIYAGGLRVARGYLDRPELTAERFIESPVNGGTRLYKTGDLARIRPDGLIEILGRRDSQIKLRGYRIELGEIEAALNDVAGAGVVMARNDPAGELRIVAYVVAGLSFKRINSRLAKMLPAHMLPDHIVRLKRLPTTAGGKVDKDQLPEPPWHRTKENSGERNYATSTEERLAAIWAEALGRPEVRRDQDFFDLGGHSLIAIRIFSRIEKEMGHVLPLAVLYEARTVAALARVIDEARPATSGKRNIPPALVAVQPEGKAAPIFCIGGGVINLNNLARVLGPQQPFYALQWQALTDEQMIRSSVEEIAGHFIDAVRAVQPKGPYRLAGSFTAGMIAVEMARQLEAAGENIALLAAFDTVVGSDLSSAADPELVQSERSRKPLAAKVARVIARGPAEIAAHLSNPYYYEKLQNGFCKMALAAYVRTGLRLPIWLRSGMGEEFFIQRAVRRHVPAGRYGGDLQLFLTPALLRKYSRFDRLGWSAWIAGRVTAHEVPGEPCFMMLPPNVNDLAQKLAACLAQVGSAGGDLGVALGGGYVPSQTPALMASMTTTPTPRSAATATAAT